MRSTLYLIFIVTSDVNFTLAINDQRVERNKIDQFATMSPSAQFNSWRFHLQHEISLSTRSDDDSLFFAQQISRSEFCEINWHSIKRSALKQIARRDTRVSKIRSSECEVLLEEDHEVTERISRPWVEWRIYIEHFHVNETKVLSREIMKHDVFMSEATERIFTKRRSSVFADDECISLSLCASWVSENDRESALMEKFSLWERWLNLTFTWRIVSLREWSWISDNDNQSLIFLFWKSVSSSWWRVKTLSTSQLSIFLFFESVSQSIVDLLARVFDISPIVDLFVLKVSQQVNSRSSFCQSTSIDLYNHHLLV